MTIGRRDFRGDVDIPRVTPIAPKTHHRWDTHLRGKVFWHESHLCLSSKSRWDTTKHPLGP
jgi:hypothetical protein